MFARNRSLLTAALLFIPATALAQTARTEVVQSTSESSQTADAEAQQGLFQQLGWEVATAEEGVRIERIVKNSPVAEAHLEEKDIIKKVAGENVLTAERISEIIAKITADGETKTDVVVLRDGEELSYLLSLDSVTGAGGGTTSRTTVQVTQADLAQMIQQLQLEAQQQRAILETLLSEMQSLRLQLAGNPNPGAGVGKVVVPSGTVVVPVGPAPVPAANPGAQPGKPRAPRLTNPQ